MTAKLKIWHDPQQEDHDPGPGHVERPSRIKACLDALSGGGVEFDLAAPRAARPAELERVHDPAFVDAMNTAAERGGGWVDPDTYIGPISLRIAERGCGALIGAVEESLRDATRSFCLIRPPGHHAGRARASGFCLLNHAAVGAAHALFSGADRVMIFDFDVHHGNGTQEIFWDEPRVLYVSMHQWPWYPWKTGSADQIGGPAALGRNLNIPLPAGSGDAGYVAAMERVTDAARRFRPDLLILSAGFDAHERDPLSLMEVTAAGFGNLVSRAVILAQELCEGRVVATLEGGYDLEGLGASFAASAKALAEPNS